MERGRERERERERERKGKRGREGGVEGLLGFTVSGFEGLVMCSVSRV